MSSDTENLRVGSLICQKLVFKKKHEKLLVNRKKGKWEFRLQHINTSIIIPYEICQKRNRKYIIGDMVFSVLTFEK